MKNIVYKETATVAAFVDDKTEYVEIRTDASDPDHWYTSYWHGEEQLGTAIANFLYADLDLVKEHLKQFRKDPQSGRDIARYWLKESALFAPLAAALETARTKKVNLTPFPEQYRQLQAVLKAIAADCLDTEQTEGMAGRYLMQRDKFPVLQYGSLFLEPGVKVKGAIPFPYDDPLNFLPTEETPETVAAETLHTESAEDLAYFLLSRCLQADVRFRKCKYCGRYFPVIGRQVNEYCNRLIAGSTKTCKELGYNKLYEKSLYQNPANKEYKRAYKTRNARIRRGLMTREEFNEWADAARQLRDRCLAGEISVEELITWLDQDKLRT